MSYERSKIKPLPLTFETLPKYAKFIAKYGKTPTQYIKEQDDKNISSLRHLDALHFSKLEKNLGSRHNLSSIPMTTVTTKNRDSANKEKDKYVLTLDEKELLDNQDLHSLIDRYGYKATGGKSKSKKNDSFNKIKNSIESGDTLVFNNKDKLLNHEVKQLLQIAINKGDYKLAEIISFLRK